MSAMAVSCRGLTALASSVLLGLLAPVSAHAQAGVCRVINLEFTPGGIAGVSDDPQIDPQIVAWLETPNGDYVKTIYITQAVGRFGLGNRPGRFDFNSGPLWPYGRRVTVFPVWSKKHGELFPQVEFQSGGEDALSHRMEESSQEVHYCKPLHKTMDKGSWDAATCATSAFTDKGIMGAAMMSYPPRNDLVYVPGTDAPSVERYKQMNQFDAVSQATPKLGTVTRADWAMPPEVPSGDYMLFMEVSLERDFNGEYTPTKYPAPLTPEGRPIPYAEYGVPYRGQPSVVYRVPIQVSMDGTTFGATDRYFGYGDPLGVDGAIRPPDATISETVIDSGASRLRLTSRDGEMFRLRVEARVEQDSMPPSTPGDMALVDATTSGATLTFVAPGDDEQIGVVSGYEVRYLVGKTPIDESNFDTANDLVFADQISAGGREQTLTVANLLPETDYTFAVRAYDNCRNISRVASTTFTTLPRPIGEVDACFVATAAYGSLLANDVEMLRRFRDLALKRSVLGQLAVGTYYTFGPGVAGVVGESDLLRTTARDILAPLIERVKKLRW